MFSTLAVLVFVALEDFVELAAAGSANDNFAAGHLLLILGLLERIDYRCDRGYEDAIGLVEKFQHRLADLSATGRIDGPALSMVASVLYQAGIAASPELTEAVAQNAKEFVPLRSAPNLAALLDDLAKECGGDPFTAASMMAETGHAMPADGRALIAAEQVRSANPVIREAAALLLLDPEPEVRRATAAELQARVTSLSPASLLRLITMRNWRAEAERPIFEIRMIFRQPVGEPGKVLDFGFEKRNPVAQVVVRHTWSYEDHPSGANNHHRREACAQKSCADRSVAQTGSIVPCHYRALPP